LPVPPKPLGVGGCNTFTDLDRNQHYNRRARRCPLELFRIQILGFQKITKKAMFQNGTY